MDNALSCGKRYWRLVLLMTLAASLLVAIALICGPEVVAAVLKLLGL